MKASELITGDVANLITVDGGIKRLFVVLDCIGENRVNGYTIRQGDKKCLFFEDNLRVGLLFGWVKVDLIVRAK